MIARTLRATVNALGNLRMALAGAAGLALIWGTLLMFEREHLQASIRSAETETRMLATTFAEHAEATMRLIDAAATDFAAAWPTDSDGFRAEVARWETTLGDLALQIGVVDRKADIIYSNLGISSPPVNLRDREHIRVHLDRTHEGLFVSRPLIGRVSRKATIQFSRVIERDGDVMGAVVVSLDPEYFHRFYGALPMQEPIRISMLRHTGELMVQVPGGTQIGRVVEGLPFIDSRQPRYGNFRGATSPEGRDTIYGFHHLDTRGVTLAAEISVDDALAGYRAERAMHVLAALGMSLALIAVVVLAQRKAASDRERAALLAQANQTLEARVGERTAELARSSREVEKLNAFLARLLHSSPAVLYTLDAGTLLPSFVSSNIAAKTGWTPEHFREDPGLWTSCVHPEDIERAGISRAKLGEAGQQGTRLRFRCRDGSYRWMQHEATLVRDADGRTVEVAGAFWDVTEAVRIEEQIHERQKLEAIGQLTGGLAHDFNNLLGIVVGNLDQIGERLRPEDALHRPYRAALDATLRGVEITRLLLAVARRQPLEVAEHDLNQLVEQMIPLVRSSVGSSIAMNVMLAETPLATTLDAAILSNVVLNLAINARDAMKEKPGARILSLRTRSEEIAPGADPDLKPGWYAVLEVGDTGTGMTPAVRAQAFEPFFTTKERGKGTGLGLSMALGYATQLGGTIHVDSAPGVGTTMRLYLPMKPAKPAAVAPPAPAPAAAQAAIAAEAQAAAEAGPSRGRILVVDDEPGLCTLACDWIRSLGYEAVGVHTPQEALDQLHAHRFDMLFTDIVMPGEMDGLALANEAKARHPGMRVLLASGYARILFENKNLPGQLLSKPYRKKE
ncbi:MAG: response regulator, partial [Alphaproteobacteria bacterium]|nr:response regulator [Alphaproteobacteria bacterium]